MRPRIFAAIALPATKVVRSNKGKHLNIFFLYSHSDWVLSMDQGPNLRNFGSIAWDEMWWQPSSVPEPLLEEQS
jgi:hypothetical protein